MTKFVQDTKYVINELEKDIRSVNQDIVLVTKNIDFVLRKFCSLFVRKKK